MEKLIRFFRPVSEFEESEWLLKRQIETLLVVAFFLGIGILAFAPVRLSEGNLIVGISQLFVGLFSLYLFWRLKQDKAYYHHYAFAFMALFFLYTWIIFFCVPQNRLNILWVVASPILIFFFLNRRGGVAVFAFVSLFVLYLILSDYRYSAAEFITLIGAFLTTTFVMYRYESVKEAEHARLMAYNRTLQERVAQKTEKLARMNANLQSLVDKELAKRREQEEMLLHQYRMARLGAMSDAIAHQWSQPLMRINAHLLDMEACDTNDHEQKRLMQSRVDRIAELTQYMAQTLQTYRKVFETRFEPEPLYPSEVFDEVMHLIAHRTKGVRVEKHCDKQCTHRLAKNALIQLFVILVDNALDICKEREIENPHILFLCKAHDDKVVLCIEDNGGGIAPAIERSLFEPYTGERKAQGGSGLGLYMAKILCEQQLGGTISARNTAEGAAFDIVLREACDAL